MPAPYYSYTLGPVQFFVVDTHDISQAQSLWLTSAIAASTSPWKIVYGHHPIAVTTPLELESTFGEAYTTDARSRLLPLIRGKVDAYFCGHHHSLQHLEPEGGVHFFVAGAGGHYVYRGDPADPRARFVLSEFGFATIEADESTLTVEFYDASATPRYQHTLRKRSSR